MGSMRARPSHPSHFVRVGPAPDPGPGRHRPRLAPESQDSAGRAAAAQRRRGAPLASVPADRSRLRALNKVSRVTAGVTRCKARPLPSSTSPHVPRAPSPSEARPYSRRSPRNTLAEFGPGPFSFGGPKPSQSQVPCHRAGVPSPRLPTYLVGTPGPALGSVFAPCKH